MRREEPVGTLRAHSLFFNGHQGRTELVQSLSHWSQEFVFSVILHLFLSLRTKKYTLSKKSSQCQGSPIYSAEVKKGKTSFPCHNHTQNELLMNEVLGNVV